MAEMIVLGHEKEEKLSEAEQHLREIILQCPNQEADAILKNADWELFYQLSSMREGLLNWYPFQKDCKILEISKGYGGLTGVLSRHCKTLTVIEQSLSRAECIMHRYEHVGNLTILVGDWSQMPVERQFDYIVVEAAVNTQYELENLLAETAPFLNKNGRLLFVCINRFGMKYWCGVPDPISHKFYAGIRAREMDELMTRRKLAEVLDSNEEYNTWELYYPFPDHCLPQAIYTDRYLPRESVRDRVIPYYPEEERKSLICLENEICDELIANGVFHIFANSFLVECGKTKFTAETRFAALSTDRGKEHGFATVISNQDTVQKKALYPDGKKSLELLHQNQQELKRRGIGCVDEKLLDDAIEMPFVKGKTLIDYLKELFRKEELAQIKEIFEQLFQVIQSSSEEVSFAECAIKDNRLTEENAGVILKNAYIDMIPYNCFYDGKKFFFYDQEFVKQYFPAKYVLFRALRYTYIYVPEADSILPLQYFKDEYALTKIWPVFEEVEARFIEDNRNYDMLGAFYKWAGVSPREVDANIERFGKEDRTETKVRVPFRRHRYDLEIYKKDVALNAVKAVQMDLLEYFMKVCEENDLSCCVFYGTLLGAVRHKGYVPWDDDVDLLMPRKDYDKLLRLKEVVFREPYFLQTPESDTECFYGGYSKLRNSKTAGLEERNRGHNCNQGIWIDIFPLDYVLKDEKQKQEQQEQILFYQRLLLKKTYPEKRMLWDMSEQEEADFLRMSKYFKRETLCQNLYKEMVHFEGERSDQVAVLARYRGNMQYKEYPANCFEYLIPCEFEQTQVYIPNGYEQCLIQSYGSNYALYPQESERVPHHNAIYDTTKSYIDYIRETGYNT